MRPWRAVVGLAVALACGWTAVAPSVLAQDTPEAPAPRARARLRPEGPVTVGQPVEIVVDVLVPSYFTGPSDYPDLDIDGALTVFVPRGSNLTEREGRVTWTGQSRRYVVHPQRAGDYVVPEIPIVVTYFADGDRGATATVTPEPIAFTATIPDAAAGLGYFIATTDLTIEQTLDPEPQTLQVGEAFTRTVTVRAPDALAMVIPPLGLTAPDGVAVYADPPTVADEGGERGAARTGVRTERVSYVAETPGAYTLQPVELVWWDVAGAALERTRLDEIAFEVTPAETEVAFALQAEADAEPAPTDAGDQGAAWLERPEALLAGLAAAVVGLVAVRRALRAAGLTRQELRRRWRARRESEPAYFARFERAARQGDARGTVRTLMAWLDRRRTAPGTATYRAFARTAGDPTLDAEARRLDARLFVADPADEPWSGTRLADRVEQARRQTGHAGADVVPALGPLNPEHRATD